MKIELTELEEQIAKKIFGELDGLTIAQAKNIIKAVLVTLHEHAFIRGEDNG